MFTLSLAEERMNLSAKSFRDEISRACHITYSFISSPLSLSLSTPPCTMFRPSRGCRTFQVVRRNAVGGRGRSVQVDSPLFSSRSSQSHHPHTRNAAPRGAQSAPLNDSARRLGRNLRHDDDDDDNRVDVDDAFRSLIRSLGRAFLREWLRHLHFFFAIFTERRR